MIKAMNEWAIIGKCNGERVDYKPFHVRTLARQVVKPQCSIRIVLEHGKLMNTYYLYKVKLRCTMLWKALDGSGGYAPNCHTALVPNNWFFCSRVKWKQEFSHPERPFCCRNLHCGVIITKKSLYPDHGASKIAWHLNFTSPDIATPGRR